MLAFLGYAFLAVVFSWFVWDFIKGAFELWADEKEFHKGDKL